MFNTLFDSVSARNILHEEDIVDEIDELDAEDGYDRFSKKTSYESKANYDAYAGVEKDEDEVDMDDFYDRDWSME